MKKTPDELLESENTENKILPDDEVDSIALDGEKNPPVKKRKPRAKKVETVDSNVVEEIVNSVNPINDDASELSEVTVESTLSKRKPRTKKVEVVDSNVVEEIVSSVNPINDNASELSEATVESIPRKRKSKQEKIDLVEVVKNKSNLPVVFKEVEEEEVSKKILDKRKKVQEQVRKKEIEDKVLEGDAASYIQVIPDSKGKTRQIIRYNTDLNTGLSSEIVEHRVSEGLNNKVDTGSTKSIGRIISSNIFTFFNVVTLCICGWLLSVGQFKDCIFIVVVSLNIFIGIYQEIRSKRVIDKLSIISAPLATILRDSDVYDVPVSDIVLDDVLILSSGKQICSDSIVVEGMIEVNESLLTGESDAIIKKTGDELFSGSFVVSGNCKAKVVKVGKDNYIEKLTKSAKKYTKPKSDLLATLHVIITFMGIIIIPIGISLFLIQMGQPGATYVESVRSTAGAMIGMIPSGLFLLTSAALYVGIIRLSQSNTLVQELYCIEMLARVDVLCLDKTGTITDGTMKVRGMIEYNNDSGVTVKNAISSMLNALNENNLTSVALEEKFGRAKRIKHTNVIPFSSARKYNAVEFDRYGTFILGAPEFVLKKNFHVIAKDVEKSASNGMRVLVLAHSNGSINGESVDGDIVPVSLILIEDTIREDAIETIKYFKDSNVEVKVISGDNALTVSKISERAGIENAQMYISLDGLSDREVCRAATKYTVFGRVSPSQKKLLVKTLKSLGSTVAMTGDGVNDILALREADCSIALASGSEAARNVSHLVLLDSNFSSMPKVVSEGRRVINNVQKVASLFLTKTIFSLLLALYALIYGNYPINTSQLLIIEMFVIGIPSVILAMEPNNNKVSGNFLVNVLKNALPGAIIIMITTILVFVITPKLNLFDYMDNEVLINTLRNQVMTTIIVINATATCFMVLLKVCRPFNLIRRTMFLTMIAFSVFLIVFMPDFFEFMPFVNFSSDEVVLMPLEAILLLLVLMQTIYPGMVIMQNLIPWCNVIINKCLKLINKIQ